MRAYAILFLLVNLILISSTKSQATNNCSEWLPLKNVNSTEFLGDWYGYQRMSNGLKRKERCSVYQYRWNSTVNGVDMVITNLEDTGNIFTIEGQIFAIDPNVAQWRVEFKNGYTFVSNAIVLNSSSYAIFAACRKNSDYIWILTRDQYPTEDVKKLITAELNKHNLDTSKLVDLCTHKKVET